MRKFLVLFLFSPAVAMAIPPAAIMTMAPDLTWSYESHPEKGGYCIVTVTRKNKVESQIVWPKSLCEERWQNFEKITARMNSPKFKSPGACGQTMTVMTAKAAKVNPPMNTATYCWDLAPRALHSDFAQWWKTAR